MQKPKQLERIMKGCSNHRRIEIIALLEKTPELSLFDIADTLKINFKTASVHVQRLANSGIVMKRYEGSMVRHALTDRGKSILKFLRILE